ncbi:MAG: hypothetical protein IPG45_30215 [Deltaproteobacteria bacterium]|nr:hypothetical protein [Deltaproteobacteria bacterium]
MRNIPLHLMKAFLEGEKVIASVEARHPSAVAWVSFIRHKLGMPRLSAEELKDKPWIYQIIHYEMPAEFSSGEWDVGKTEMLYYQKYTFPTVEEADAVLDELVGDPSKFVLRGDLEDWTPF